MLSWGFIVICDAEHPRPCSAVVASGLELYFRLVSVTAQTRYGVTFNFVDLLFNIVHFSYVQVINLFNFTCNVALLFI
jgi:hypothetical protein